MTTNLKQIYLDRGLNGLNSALKKVAHKREVYEFGLSCNKKARHEKQDFLLGEESQNEIRVHYYSVAKKSSKTGYSYNLLRGIKITIL